MKTFFKFFLDNSRLTTVITLACFILGIAGFKNLRRESRPAVDFAQVLIFTLFPGASTTEVEEQITFKIEERIRLVDGIKEARSISSPGSAYTHLTIDIDNTHSQEVVDEIQREVTRVTGLPEDVLDQPYVTHIKAKEIPLLRIVLTGDNQNRKRDQIAFQLKSLIEKNKGVAEVQLMGYQEREFKVLLNVDKMNFHHVSIEEVLKAVNSHTKDFSVGMLRSQSQVRQVRFLGKIKKAEQLENIVVRSNFSGQKILIKDLATVIDDQQEVTKLIRFNNQPATQLFIKKKEKSDSIQLSESIKKMIQSYSLPKGYQLQIYGNEADTTKKQLATVMNNAWVGLLLVLIVLLLLLPGWIGVLSALSLPISILGTVVICSAFGITFNTITMLAFIICIGMLVDNAVVVSENYARLRADNLSPEKASLTSVMQLNKPITATVLTTVFAFLPMLVTKGVMGQFIMWIPIVVSVALLVSLFDAFMLLPSRLKWTLRKAQIQTTKIQKFMHSITNRFEKFIIGCIKHRYLCFLGIFVLVSFSISINFWGNEFILFPKRDVRHYTGKFETKEGASVKQTDRLTQPLLTDIIKVIGMDHIEGLFSNSGGQQSSFRSSSTSEHKGDLFLFIKKESPLREKNKEVLDKLRKIDKRDLTKLEFDSLAHGPPVGTAVHLIFTADNRETLNQIKDEFKNELSQIEGLIDIEDDQLSTGPEYAIQPNHKKLAELKISAESLSMSLAVALRGLEAGELVENGESFFTRIYYDQTSISTLDNLKKIKILSPSGSLISLGELVTIKDKPKGSFFMKRFNFQPSIEVKAKIDEKVTNAQKANQKIEKILEQMMKKFPSVSYEFSGERKSTKESMESLFQAMVLAIFGIFAILLLLFRGFLVSFLALSSICLGFVGISIAFALHERPLSFLAMIGIVGLAGVTINASIILLSFIEDTKKQHPDWPLYAVLAQSTKYRLKPIVITTFTTILGLFPAAYGLGGSDQILIPMTLAFTWGLMTGSLLTLLWIPCGYAIIDDISRWTSTAWNKLFH